MIACNPERPHTVLAVCLLNDANESVFVDYLKMTKIMAFSRTNASSLNSIGRSVINPLSVID